MAVVLGVEWQGGVRVEEGEVPRSTSLRADTLGFLGRFTLRATDVWVGGGGDKYKASFGKHLTLCITVAVLWMGLWPQHTQQPTELVDISAHNAM